MTASPSGNRRQNRRQARTNAVLDMAMCIVEEQGLEGLTIARLAERLDSAVGSLYRYFPSKQDLLVAMQLRTIEQFQEEVEALLEALPPAPRPGAEALARIMAAMCAYLDDAARNPARHRLMAGSISTPAALLTQAQAQQVNEALMPLLRHIEALFDRAVEVGALSAGDNLQRTHALWSCLHGVGQFRKRDRLQPPALRTPALTEVTLRAMLGGWGATPEALSAAWAHLGREGA